MTNICSETFGKGKPIVLVHGWAMHSGIWRNFARELALSYQVTLIDLPGHGRSEAVKPFTLETISGALLEVIDDEASCWLGWSLGAEVVLEICRRYPDRANKLMLLSGTPCFVKKDTWPGMDVQVLDSFAGSLQHDCQSTLFRFLALQVNGMVNQKAIFQELKDLVYQTHTPDQGVLVDGLSILKQTDLRPAFADLHIPVAVILGQLDTLVPVAVGAKLRELLPDIDLTIIDRAGHVPFLTHPERVTAAIHQFMAK
ncbi:MAG: pimeloyl-ACP methyl ester esterase BioH [Methyloglobulus sp.]|nr:pimeloyl-ACP methyl ester esterase BioH [Methyloglobulus sp.]